MFKKTITVFLALMIVTSAMMALVIYIDSNGMALTTSSGSTHSSENVNESLFRYFSENSGQWPSEVKYSATTVFGNVAFTDSGFFYYLSTSENNTTEVIVLKLIGANDVTPGGYSQLPSSSNYIVGNDPSKWLTGVNSYERITYKNIWDGIDLSFYFSNGCLKYEFIVEAHAKINDIAIQVDGANISVQNGSLVIESKENRLNDSTPTAYYKDDHEGIASTFIVRNNVYSFSLGDHNESRAIVIDPMVYSTFLGGSGDDYGYTIAVDASGCAYVAGYTASLDFPTTAGTFDKSIGGKTDMFVTKVNAKGNGLVYSTYLGGSGNDYGYTIAIDANGCAYLSGTTESSNFPTSAGAYNTSFGGVLDAFVTKLNANGSGLVYSTYIGGSLDDRCYGIAVDASDCAFITGTTWSSDFPVTTGAYKTSISGERDAFVTKLNANGTGLIFSTCLGGKDVDYGYDIAIDSSDLVYVAGVTWSSDFPTTGGAYDTSYNGGISDAFITKLNANGTGLIYSTLLGGAGEDECFAIAIDASGNAYVTGDTGSTDFPTTVGAYDSSLSGSQDAFVTKLNANGTDLVYSTYIGGIAREMSYSLAIDSSGNAYITGDTGSTDFPTTSGANDRSFNGGSSNGGNTDAYMTKLNATGTGLLYSTFIGGSDNDYSYSIAVDSAGNVYITGGTYSTDFPTTSRAYDTSHNNGEDGLIVKIATTANSVTSGDSNTQLMVIAFIIALAEALLIVAIPAMKDRRRP